MKLQVHVFAGLIRDDTLELPSELGAHLDVIDTPLDAGSSGLRSYHTWVLLPRDTTHKAVGVLENRGTAIIELHIHGLLVAYA